MARIKVSDDLKHAISELPSKEKDKLLFRLLPKDQKLIHRLEFQLLEYGETQEERRNILKSEILELMSRYPAYYYSPGYLLLSLRELSGKITYHKDVTRDKFGEIELNYLMITEAIEKNFDHLYRSSYYSAKSFNEYVVKRILKLLKLSASLHEDYLLEFEEYMVKLGHFLSEIPSMKNSVREHDLDINALLNAELP